MKFLLGLLVIASTAFADEFPPGWAHHQDIGPAEVKGTASYTASERSFTVKGTLDTWGTNDGFHILWQEVRGNIVFNARVLSVENTAAHAKAGLMIRESLTPGSRHAEICVTPADGTQFLSRAETNGKTTAAPSKSEKGKFPIYLKIERTGETLSSFESFDGATWKPVGSVNLALPEKVYIGMVASSHDKTKLCAAKFDQLGMVSRSK